MPCTAAWPYGVRWGNVEGVHGSVCFDFRADVRAAFCYGVLHPYRRSHLSRAPNIYSAVLESMFLYRARSRTARVMGHKSIGSRAKITIRFSWKGSTSMLQDCVVRPAANAECISGPACYFDAGWLFRQRRINRIDGVCDVKCDVYCSKPYLSTLWIFIFLHILLTLFRIMSYFDLPLYQPESLVWHRVVCSFTALTPCVTASSELQ
jgi:hypothetical protein